MQSSMNSDEQFVAFFYQQEKEEIIPTKVTLNSNVDFFPYLFLC